jgi:hypothetical protein
MNEQDFYYSNSIIKPPTEAISDKKKYHMVIDSYLRNKNLFPNPNDYSIDFYSDLNNVISVKLINIDLPFSSYLINVNCGSFIMSYNGGSLVTISLDYGDYTASELVTMIQSKINSAYGSAVVSISYNSNQDKFQFTSANGFVIKFDNYLKEILGFINDTNNSVSNVLTAPYRKNFEINNYIVMQIEQFNVLDNENKLLKDSFAIIPKTYTSYNLHDDDIHYKKTFTPPIARLAKIRVKFLDRFGNLYDFQNIDHRFEIIFETHHSYRKTTFASV